MLIGQYKSKLTDKDRVSVPAKFRSELGAELMIARWYERCLVLVSKKSWTQLVERLTGKQIFVTSAVRDVDRFIFGSAFEIKLDSQGRFVLPEILKQFAQIVSETVFVGLEDRVEIWSLERWESLESKVEDKASLAIEKIARNVKD